MRILILLLLAPFSLSAQVQYTESELLEAKTGSAEWGISVDEWHQYKQLMSGARGIWSPDADPLSVLGAEAETVAERKRYARLFVEIEAARVKREISFQMAINEARAELYPIPEKLPTSDRSATLEQKIKPHTFAVIVGPDCTECDVMLNGYLQQVKAGVVGSLDIHVKGTGGDKAKLDAYLSDQGVPVELIQKTIFVEDGSDYDHVAGAEAYQLGEDNQWLRVQ